MHKRAKPQREPAVSILFLEGPKPTFAEDEIPVSRQLKIGKVTEQFVTRLEQSGIENAREMLIGTRLFIQYDGTDSTEDLTFPHAMYKALVLSCEVPVRAVAHFLATKRFGMRLITRLPIDKRASSWGHHGSNLTEYDIRFAQSIYQSIAEVHLTDSYHRVGNALLFYMNGYELGNPDLALVSFTTALEALFSTIEQEISFRLSLRTAQFLGDSAEERREIYSDCRTVYNARSKIVHGARLIRGSAEKAAIYLVEGMLPIAEKLTRASLRKIFELRLQDVFNNPARIEASFDELLFGQTLESVLRKQS